MSGYAPVAIFAYRRADHLRVTIDSLMRCKGFDESPVIVYGDGARDQGEHAAVEATRDLAMRMLGEKAEFRFSQANLGLSRSIIRGVNETVRRFDRVIVVEDDLELSPSFLIYMNQALSRYADEEKVFQVSGYMFDLPELAGSCEALFLPFTVSWGWATWKRAWDYFDPQAEGWEKLRSDKVLRRRFNLDGTYDFASMLARQMAGLRDSWAVRWYWTVFKMNGLVLFPPFSMVRNTGFDGSGTHGRGRLRRFSKDSNAWPTCDVRLPDAVQADAEQYQQVKKAMWLQNGGWMTQMLDWARRCFKG